MTPITGTTVAPERVDLRLAVDLADAASLREAVAITLPVVAEVSGAAVVVFAVAGTADRGGALLARRPRLERRLRGRARRGLGERAADHVLS